MESNNSINEHLKISTFAQQNLSVKYQILENINSPRDLKKLKISELDLLAVDLRAFVQEATKTKAGHIKSSLGVVELTIAIHFVYDMPEDILVWDVGHQAYIHKILTERKNTFHSNRQFGGLSGFTKREESIYDPFGAGHSSTSISAISGFAEGAKLNGIDRNHIAVLGDGALTGGESFEALNYIGDRNLNCLIIINDNESSIDDNVGALAKYQKYQDFFSALNFDFIGSVDGHDTAHLVETLSGLKNQNGPKVLRVLTEKGKGWIVEKDSTIQAKKELSFQEVFGEKMCQMAFENEKIVAISPAMISGGGLNEFKKKFPTRTFDVGIAEQHAVTMSAALAADGFIPICHLYSTFAQRAYDQIIHDVALQNLPVVFCLDRSGLVGEDGATHHGNFDPGFLNTIPNLILSAPMDGNSLSALLTEGVKADKPFVIRYPKGGSFSKIDLEKPLALGKLRPLKKGLQKAFISYGAIGLEVEKALRDTSFSHYDLVYLKPIDEEAIRKIFSEYTEVVTVEENSSAGGLGEKVASLKAQWDSPIKLSCHSLPDLFIEHGPKNQLLQLIQMDENSIKDF